MGWLQRHPLDAGAWVLVGLLAMAGVVALVRPQQGPLGGFAEEATYLLQAESLARDFDRLWGPEDQARNPAADEQPLIHSDERPVFARPPVYSLFLAPFVRLVGARGAAVANVLLLSLAALGAFRVLARQLGDSAGWLLALAIFASVVWADAYLAQPEILLLSASVAAFALAFGLEQPAKERLGDVYRSGDQGWRPLLRWMAVGCLLAVPILHHPRYLLPPLPAAVAIPASRRRSAIAALGVGAVLVLLVFGIADRAASGSWMPSGWRAIVLVSQQDEKAGSTAAEESSVLPAAMRPGLDGRVLGWNLVYLAAGRNVGILPFFLPVVVLLGAWRGGGRRSTLVVVVFVTAVLFALVEPFNFFGGPGAVANRWFVPLYGALWFVPSRPVPRSWMALTALGAALIVWPLWLPPGGGAIGSDGFYRHSSSQLCRWLPYETTQRALASGGESSRARLWIRAVAGARVIDGSRGLFELSGDAWAELLVAAPVPLDSIFLDLAKGARTEIEVGRGEFGGTVFQPNGGVGFEILAPRRRRHRMWWTETTRDVYLFSFRMPGAGDTPIRFKVAGLPTDSRQEQ